MCRTCSRGGRGTLWRRAGRDVPPRRRCCCSGRASSAESPDGAAVELCLGRIHTAWHRHHSESGGSGSINSVFICWLRTCHSHARAACCCRYGPALYAWLNGYATGVGHHINYYKVTCKDSLCDKLLLCFLPCSVYLALYSWTLANAAKPQVRSTTCAATHHGYIILAT
jgi:hypothetical protein